MAESITRQSMPEDDMLYLLGISQWVFNSNCGFLLEMIDKEHHGKSNESWYTMVKLTAGQLKEYKGLIVTLLNSGIYDLFGELVNKRNAIIHSLPTGKKVGNCAIPVYRDKYNNSIDIDKAYLQDFIKKNEELSSLIHAVRGY